MSVNIQAKLINFGTLVVEAHSEGNLSQIFYLGPKFYFMKSRNLVAKNSKQLPVFCDKIKTRTQIKILRHGSLQINVIHKITKL